MNVTLVGLILIEAGKRGQSVNRARNHHGVNLHSSQTDPIPSQSDKKLTRFWASKSKRSAVSKVISEY